MAAIQTLYPSLPILIVDDDEQSLLALAGTLRTAGITNLRTSSDSRVVPTLLRHEAFSLVLLDLIMPGLAGYEILRRAGELKSRPPFIIVTGSLPPRDFAATLPPDVVDYLEKPVDRERLIVAVRRVLGGSHQGEGVTQCSGT
ncbi:MAG TPA: response regulator [Rectinemataceae bacterium]|nr:response regulator [Rectinemataceae bacterium]